jgi:UDP-3-O-[3-hydroxymyristoyl] glucosamine N-acyltransferase
MVSTIEITNYLKTSHFGEEKFIELPRFLDRPKPHSLFFLTAPSLIKSLHNEIVKTSFFIIERGEFNEKHLEGVSYCLSNNCRLNFSFVFEHFWSSNKKVQNNYSRNNQQNISSKARIGENVQIGKFTIIEEEVTIGNNVIIGSHCILKKGVIIGNNVILESFCVIGQNGWWFTYDENNENYHQLPHIGIVEIKDGCHIGSYTNIDRGINPERNTIINKNVIINDKVHIAHGVLISMKTKISAGVKICGEVKIGENCWLATNASIHHLVEICDNVIIGMNSAVTRSIIISGTYYGSPAKLIKKC